MLSTVLLVCLLTVVPTALSSHDLNSTYKFQATLHEDYTLYWTFDNDAQNITFAVRVRTTGWVGFGLSPNGQMPQSDVVIGWVDGTGGNHFDDRFADGRSLPPVDEQQDWFLLRAEEEGGYTTLEFTRNYTSCDTKDRNIKHETARVVWSWNDNDPVNDVPTFHQKMGTTSLNLLGGLLNRPADPADAMTLSITAKNILLPNVDTTYWCTAFRAPQEFSMREFYVTKFAPVITPGNEKYVHHLLVYLCDGLDGVELDEGGPCATVDPRIQQCLTRTLIGAWAVGGEEFVYPSNVAYPIGGTGSSPYIAMETHYDNPGSGVQDSSGMVFTYTPTRREHDAGILSMGHLVTQGHIIPPNAEGFTSYGVCPSDCTQQYLPTGGIKVFGSFLHTHLVGSGVELTVLKQRDSCGNTSRYEQVAVIERNLNYDFNYQQFVYLPQEITVMPGDTFQVRCIYKTTNRTGVTLGGASTHDEMCLASAVYYPRVPMDACISLPQFNDYINFVRRHVPTNLQQSFLSLTGASRSRVKEILNQIPWTQQQREAFEDSIYITGLQTAVCATDEGRVNTTTLYTPQVCCPYEVPDTCTNTRPTPCCDRRCDALRELPTSGATTLLSRHIFVFTCLSVVIAILFAAAA